MRLLVIGGTVFVGRATVEAALTRGHEVTVFHRGQHGETAVPQVEHLHGDRRSDADLLAGRQWDAVVDTCGFSAADVEPIAEVLDGVDRYVFVSSVSVYTQWPAEVVDEDSPVKAPDDEDAYGAGKVAAERALEAVLGDRLIVTRPGLIVGPYENIGRLPFWLRYAARGGRMVAPGSPDESRQWIDARDHGEFTLDLLENDATDTYNVISPPGAFTIGDVIDACVTVTGAGATPQWTPPERIVAAGFTPWSELPLWLWDADEDMSATWQVDVSRALAAGLRSRPVVATVADTWQWLRTEGDSAGGYRSEYAVPELDVEKERVALR